MAVSVLTTEIKFPHLPAALSDIYRLKQGWRFPPFTDDGGDSLLRKNALISADLFDIST